MRTVFSRIVLAASAALMLTGGAALAQDVIQTRKAGFEDYKKAMGEIKDAVGKGDLAAVGPVADRVDAFATKIPGLFPPGSDKGRTAAKEVIWANFPDFTAKAQGLQASAQALKVAASTGDKAATAKAFGAMADSCKACHQRYRSE
ncbi:cytochrome C [Azospirillum thiophilum]|uniref:Cytochrome C n=1 Tax=Azospirillum thiophilum TaxID=528244 RepID=A0AAC8ZTA0_9PROT|nr:cytochrome c [Azospirillum thiophilum]ALG70417.1 cytochrome C [Azospirillum thiophilum]KJR65904.1 cytochrome C [Azospirillum thiophilum]